MPLGKLELLLLLLAGRLLELLLLAGLLLELLAGQF
jgi:hypothetical protein